MEGRIAHLEVTLDKSLEMNTKSNEEIIKLKKVVESLVEGMTNHQANFIAHQEKIEPMYLWFNNITFTKRLIMWILGILSAIGGLILLFRDVFKGG